MSDWNNIIILSHRPNRKRQKRKCQKFLLTEHTGDFLVSDFRFVFLPVIMLQFLDEQLYPDVTKGFQECQFQRKRNDLWCHNKRAQ